MMKRPGWLWMRWIVVLAAGVCANATTGQVISISDELGPAVVPFRELAYSASDVAEVRRRARQGANPELVKQILNECDRWMALSDEQLLALIPPPDASFAYGIAGDPKTGKAWPRWGRSDDMCSIDRPYQVKSPYTGDIYGIQKPGEEYYDPGDGWVRPSDGKKFFFKGVWHAYIDHQLHDAVDNLAIGYMLTGNPAIARRALVILDHFAAMRAQRPEADGVADWVYEIQPGKGFFSHMGNLANDRTVYTGLSFDLLANAPYAAQPSCFDSATTVRDNILRNYFDVYEKWYIEDKSGLQNHALMVLANMTVQGLLFGREDYLRTAIDGTYAFLDGTFNRDGDYYEIAGGYGHLGRSYGAVMTTLLSRYDPARYDNVAELPRPADYPHQLKFGDDRRWYTCCSDMLFRLPVLGRDPQYGDAKCDRSILLDQTYTWLAWRRCTSLSMIEQSVTRPDWREHVQQLNASIRPADCKEPMVKDVLLQGLSQWPPQVKAAAAKATEPMVGRTSDVMPGKGIIILRSGEGVDKRALFIRGGVNTSHGHDDQMAIVPYGNGMVLTGEYGYNFAGTSDHVGWGTRAIAHLTATVNQDRPAPYLYKGTSDKIPSPPSDIVGYLPAPPAQCFEMRNPAMWKAAAKDIQDYRRLSWLIDVDAQRYYFIDVLQIVGGQVHDYTWNAPYDDHESADTFNLTGLDPQSQPDVWTLASLDGGNRNATWNKPKQSWGERLNGAGDGQVRDIGLGDLPPKDKLYKWNPPPGNGYGMIWDVKTQQTDDNWSATWKLVDGKHYLRNHVLNLDGMTAVTARSPSLLMDKHHHLIVERRTQSREVSAPLRSRFVSVVEVGAADDWPVKDVQKPALKAEREADAVAVRVDLADGQCDQMLASRMGQHMSIDGLTVQGCRGFARVDADGKLVHLALQDGTLIEAGGWRIETDRDRFEAVVREAQAGWDESRLTIDQALPSGAVLAGSMVLIDSPPGAAVPYTHSNYYAIESIKPADQGSGCTLVFHDQTLIATRLRVGSVDTDGHVLHSEWPNELATQPGSHEFDGYMIAARQQPQRRTLIRNFVKRDVQVLRADSFRVGDDVDVYTAKPNDRLVMPTTVTLTRSDDGSYMLRTNAAVTLTCHAAKGQQLLGQVGDQEPQTLAAADEQGVLQVVIDPAKINASEIHLSWHQR